MKIAIQTRKIKNDKALLSTFEMCGSLNQIVILEHPELFIPAGVYEVERNYTGKYRDWEILNVEDRSNIEIHVGNTIDDTMGCPLPGLYTNQDNTAVVRSGEALGVMHDWFGDDAWK